MVKRRVEYVKCVCGTCKKEFEILPSQYRDGRGRFCSHACSHNRPGGDPRDTKGKKSCEVCGAEFEVKKYRQDSAKYCSQGCYRLGRRSEKKVCSYCGKEYEGSKAARGGKMVPKKYCSRKCRDDARNTRVELVCAVCGIKFLVRKHKEETAKCCSVLCKAERQAMRMASGELKNSYTYSVSGSYTSRLSGKREYFDSWWEKIRMIQLDRLGLEWTKKHKIVLPYRNSEGKKRRYIPDFLVSDGQDIWIEEVKPKFKLKEPDTVIKNAVGESFCLEKGWGFKILTEEELGITSQVKDENDVLEVACSVEGAPVQLSLFGDL